MFHLGFLSVDSWGIGNNDLTLERCANFFRKTFSVYKLKKKICDINKKIKIKYRSPDPAVFKQNFLAEKNIDFLIWTYD